MFDIGFWELMLIGVVGLIVIGPERLPAVARKIGYWVGRTRRFISNVRADIDREIRQDELRQALQRDASLDEIKNIINDSRYTIEDEITEAQQEPVVRARDNDLNEIHSETQKELLNKQEEEFENDDYGLTDHTDYGLEEGEPPVEHENKPKPVSADTKQHEERKTKSS